VIRESLPQPNATIVAFRILFFPVALDRPRHGRTLADESS
jgi:hypothetical protein